MKRFITICGALAVAGMIAMPLTAQAEGVSVGKGACKLSGIFQGQFRIYQAVGATGDTEINDSFDYSRARLLLIGNVTDNVKYIFQGDAKSSPWLLDARMIFLNVFSNTEIQVGRFLPNFTYYMPQLVSKLEFVNYPLLTTTYAMWRQVGVQSTTKFGAHSLNVGILNSIVNANTWNDSDNWKDFLVRLNLNPGNVQAAIYALLGQTWTDTLLEEPGYYLSMRMGGFLRATIDKLIAQAELLYAMENIDPDSVNGLALYAQAMYNASEKVAAGVRFEYKEPNMDADDDEVMRLTVALNYMIEAINVMLSTNFIYDIQEPESLFQLVEQAQVAF